MRKLFVSYARENKPDVDQLVEHLATMGYETWVDAALRGGQDWWDEILDRIADTDVVIAIYSSAALNSTACGREFEWAAALKKPIVPVAVEPPPTALPSRFARRQIIDYSQPEQRPLAALKLQGALAAVPPAPPLPDPLPDPPKAPLSYLTDIIDAITQTNAIDHDQQHQILLQLEPALSSVDPLERRGGRDILERFSRRADLYADIDRAIARLRSLADQSAAVGTDLISASAVSTSDPDARSVVQHPAIGAPESQVRPDKPDTSATVTAAKPVGAPTANTTPATADSPTPARDTAKGVRVGKRARAETASGVPPPPSASHAVRTITPHLWRVALASGVLAAILGAVWLLWPLPTPLTKLTLVAAYLLMIALAQGVFAFGVSGVARAVLLIGSAALILLAALEVAATPIVLSTLGVGLLCCGAAQTVAASISRDLPGRLWWIAVGVVNLLAGAAIAELQPMHIAAAGEAIGVCLLIVGVCEVVSAFAMRKATHQQLV